MTPPTRAAALQQSNHYSAKPLTAHHSNKAFDDKKNLLDVHQVFCLQSAPVVAETRTMWIRKVRVCVCVRANLLIAISILSELRVSTAELGRGKRGSVKKRVQSDGSW